MLMAVFHTDAMGWEEVDDLSRISELRGEGKLLWGEADVAKLTTEDLELIRDEFDLPPLAVEDAVHLRQRPKFDSFEMTAFIVMHQLDERDGQLESLQLANFVGDHFVLTIHEGAERTLKEARERWGEVDRSHNKAPAALLYTILDAVVDDYESIADDLEVEVEDLEELSLQTMDVPHRLRSKTGAAVQERVYKLKQRVARLRRYALPSRNVVAALLESTAIETPREITHWLRDVEDHLIRIGHQIRNVDELSAAVLELQRAQTASALSDAIKKLTSWAAIIAVPTLISGVYGMNFHLVPADNELFGFWFALSLMAVTVTGLYLYFKKRNWI